MNDDIRMAKVFVYGLVAFFACAFGSCNLYEYYGARAPRHEQTVCIDINASGGVSLKH